MKEKEKMELEVEEPRLGHVKAMSYGHHKMHEHKHHEGLPHNIPAKLKHVGKM